MKRVLKRSLLPFGIIALLLAALYWLGEAIQGREQFNRVYLWLFGASVLAVALLSLVIVQRLVWLYFKRKHNEPGIRLTTRMVTTFIALSLPPVLILYLFANQFVDRYVDSWFSNDTEKALRDSLSLGQIFLETQTRRNLAISKRLARELASMSPAAQVIRLDSLLEDAGGATSLSLLDDSGTVLANSNLDPFSLKTSLPPQQALQNARSGQVYARVEPAENGLQIRTLVPVAPDPLEVSGRSRFLQALFAVPSSYSALVNNIEATYHDYKRQAYQRTQVKQTFIIILTIVLLLSVLLALLRAFSAARQLVAPVRLLSEATQSIAKGEFGHKIPVESDDELGFLVKSFNTMSSQLAASSALAHRSQVEAESQRWYLQSVLAHLSSGVLSIDKNQRILMANSAASAILHLDLKDLLNQNVEFLSHRNRALQPLVDLIVKKLEDRAEEWQQEVLLAEDSFRRILVVRGSRIPEREQEEGGLVVVFDDETVLNQAQRDAAWGEVARRLAHEVKNPLTPIQLSAERLRLRFLSRMAPEDAEIMNRTTGTIISQVETLKTLVNAFSDYAKAPQLKREPGGLNQLIREAVNFYSLSHPGIDFSLDLSEPEPVLLLDKNRIQQLLTNLIKNAQESQPGSDCRIAISTRVHDGEHGQALLMRIRDHGQGFDEELLEHLFEPYVTTKTGGSGLGLAIVKKIVEEHGGQIRAYNHPEGGAVVEIRLPVHPLASSGGPGQHITGT